LSTAQFFVHVPHSVNSTVSDDGAAAGYSVNSNCASAKSAVRRIAEAPGYVLEQNFPNPFNPSTSIVFGIPVDSDVRLTVHDLNGREVAALSEGFHPAGGYSVSFDASNLTSGIYIYTLQAGSVVMRKTMQLVK
jgi:hypothetical protein